MRTQTGRESGLLIARLVLALGIAAVGILLGLISVGASPSRTARPAVNGAVSALPTWDITASPNLTDQDFAAVTCLSATDCWAVGTYADDSFTQQTLIEHWNGASWTIVPSPTAGFGDNFLNGVTCTSTSNCWAVGAYTGSSAQQTLIEHWDGIGWSIVASPNSSTTAQNYLNAITCSATDCWAVGFKQGASANQTLIERWNGTQWAIVTSTNSSTTQSNELTGVTCAASNLCFAVGNFDSGANGQRTLIEKWNGTAWSTVANTPNGSTTHSNVLNAVACAATTDCEAVGYYNNGTASQTLVLRLSNTTWSAVTSPNVDSTHDNMLNSVACTTGTNCWAVGTSSTMVNNNPISHTLIERWNGTAWSIVTSPNTDPLLPNELSGVTCTGTSDCWAVGSYTNSINQTLAEHWSGSVWSIAGSADVAISGTFTAQSLNAIACSGPTDCWSVGFFDPGGDRLGIDQTLIEHWDGSMWSIITSPNTGALQPNFLNAVACTSASNCWASGDYAVQGVHQTLILHWDGTSWTVAVSPNTNPTLDNFLNGITCSSASQCWAAGGASNGSVTQTLIEQWNGMTWSIISSPNTSTSLDNQLNAVTCIAATDCWAVGTANNGTVTQTFTAHWNGSAWSAMGSPSTSSTQQNFLNSVTCLSGSNCWAIGGFVQSIQTRTLTLKWNGAAWSIVMSPNTNNTDPNNLFSVACVSNFDCSAVGSSANTPAQTLINRWNGGSWSILASPDSSSSEPNVLNGVTCVPAADCWAVGSYTSANTGAMQTLILQRTTPLLGITAVSRPASGGSAGHFIVTGKAVPNSTINVYATQNFANGLSFLNSTMADSNGNFQYDDAGAAGINPPQRFYQVAYP